MDQKKQFSIWNVPLGGRAAEHLVLAHLSTGAADDLATAILSNHRDTLEQGAELLLVQETLTEPELAAIQESLPMAAAHAEPPGDSG